jgi:hypothetical protein
MTCVKSDNQTSVGWIRRSSSHCWSTTPDSPREIGCEECNTAETTTIVPTVTSFIERHGLNGASMVVAADAGMLSTSNLKALDALGSSFIVGSRTTRPPGTWSRISIGTVAFSPMGKSSTPPHPGTPTRKSTTPPYVLKRS